VIFLEACRRARETVEGLRRAVGDG
jgi:hypothetical protein